MPEHTRRIIGGTLALAIAVTLWADTSAVAQTCWVYVDSEQAKAPFECRQQGNLLASCSWNGGGSSCHEDPAGDLSDCCTSVPSSSILENTLRMHTRWHQCFGNVGRNDGNNPPGRGQRWYAFHRQFEIDFNAWRDQNTTLGPIESLEWLPNMLLPIPHPGVSNNHPDGCGVGVARPPNRTCPECEPFAQCLYMPGGGPSVPGVTPSGTCGNPGLGSIFPYSSLDQFPNVDEISNVLDAYFHGRMHGAVAAADRVNCGGPGQLPCYIDDSTRSACSPRDPMFWRLHKALDDVVRAWQDRKAVDIMLVVDRSGSMSDPDPSGLTKLEAALQAVDNFADLLEDTRPDGLQNRIGLVSYSDTATVDMPLTPADSTLRQPSGPLQTALNSIRAQGPGGCTGIGAALEAALSQLCPPSGNCEGFSVAGDNDRKATLLLTDGLENGPPCLNPAGTSGPTCGIQCFGAPLDYNRLQFTQLVAVGFGNATSLNGDLLTLLAERQGGIYLQNPGTAGNDLKDSYVKAFGSLTNEFLLLDPKGMLAGDQAVSPPVEHTACDEGMLTFDGGWDRPVKPGELRLLVTSPAGDLVRAGEPLVESSLEPLWAFERVRFPYKGASAGTWRGQLVRPHWLFVNGFAPDAFARPDEGITIVRRQIHRLCPDGCKEVLLYEQGRRGSDDAYEAALQLELQSGLIGNVVTETDPQRFADALLRQPWDLIVYARMGDDQPEPYDDPLARLICGGQRAILTETRKSAEGNILECARVRHGEGVNWEAMDGDGQLFDGTVRLRNPGHPVASYALVSTLVPQARVSGDQRVAVAARADAGEQQNWFINVLGEGLSKVAPVRMRRSWSTGQDIVVSARILPSYVPAGGYDHVDARVEVEYPTVGLGTLLAEAGLRGPREVRGELIDPRAAALAQRNIPTKTAVFQLHDDGSDGDQHANNQYWSATLRGIGAVDGAYKLRYILDLTANGCTSRREATETLLVGVNVDPRSSPIRIEQGQLDPEGSTRAVRVAVQPADAYGNLWGPGDALAPSCMSKGCRVDPRSVEDHGDGWYSFDVTLGPGSPSARVDLFGAAFDIPTTCADCPSLDRIVLDQLRVDEDGRVKGSVSLSGPAPSSDADGAEVFLRSSDLTLAPVPDTVVVPVGQRDVTFEIAVGHLEQPASPTTVVIEASYGGQVRSASVMVMPVDWSTLRGVAPARATEPDYPVPHHN